MLGFLLNDGYQILLNKPYKHVTTTAELNFYKSYCNPFTILCLGGGVSNSTAIRIAACAKCKEILTITTITNNPSYIGTAWWYYTNSSIGFASSNLINQQPGDINDPTNENRLSWEIGGYGYRVGSLTASNYNIDLLVKYIFIKNGML